MKAKDAYEKYHIMPTLAEHMYLVGAVAKIYTDQIQQANFPAREIVSACLLHDMGNIVKFDLDNVPKGLNIPDIDNWKIVQEEVRIQYGTDEHDVTQEMAKGLGVSEITLNAIANCGTAKAQSALDSENTPAMFVTFSDYHIAPTKIVTPEERLEDILNRYQNHPKHAGYQRDGQSVLRLANYLRDQYSLNTSLVTDESVKETASNLRNWELT